MMLRRAHKESMQRSLKASSGCLRPEAFPYNLKETPVEGFTEIGDEAHANPLHMKNAVSSLNREASAPPNQVSSGDHYQQELCMLQNLYPDGRIHMFQQGQWDNHGTHFYPMHREYPFPIENRIHYVPFEMLYHNYTQEFQFQDFHYFVVIDFEATCDKDRNPHPQEIIEFPSVAVNSMTGVLEACFQTYVRPSCHQHLTDFCKELTGIQQFQVDRGVPLSEALLMHDKWLDNKGIKQSKFAVVTWSNWDCRVMLESECKYKGIRKPSYFNSWINLKIPFQEVFNGVRCNLKDAVELAGLPWEGRPHCGLDDARNTARLLTNLMRRGCRLSITNSLIQHLQPPATSINEKLPVDLGAPPPLPSLQKELPVVVSPSRRNHDPFCFCGVVTSRGIMRRPGPMLGKEFFGCSKWTNASRSGCNYFAWVP